MLLCYITCVMLCTYVMLYNICKMLCYITNVMLYNLCYMTHVMLHNLCYVI